MFESSDAVNKNKSFRDGDFFPVQQDFFPHTIEIQIIKKEKNIKQYHYEFHLKKINREKPKIRIYGGVDNNNLIEYPFDGIISNFDFSDFVGVDVERVMIIYGSNKNKTVDVVMGKISIIYKMTMVNLLLRLLNQPYEMLSFVIQVIV